MATAEFSKFAGILSTALSQHHGAKDRETLYSQQKQDWELTVAQVMNSLFAKFRLKLKKVGKTPRPFRYDLNQINLRLYRGDGK